MIINTPQPPYYSVIFTSLKKMEDDGYQKMAEQIRGVVQGQSGFLGMESVRDIETGLGITVSYWADLEAISRWRNHLEHQEVKKQGRVRWYRQYKVRIAKVEREYRGGFELD